MRLPCKTTSHVKDPLATDPKHLTTFALTRCQPSKIGSGVFSGRSDTRGRSSTSEPGYAVVCKKSFEKEIVAGTVESCAVARSVKSNGEFAVGIP
jgi:hypothetical protein